MTPRGRSALLLGLGLGLGLASGAAMANNCDSIAAGIDSRLRAGGLSHYTLLVVDVAASAAGRVVGSCDRGSKKIVQVGGAASAAAGARPPSRDSGIITECKDGRVITQGDCSRR